MTYGKNKLKELMLLILEVDLLILILQNGKKIFITIDTLQKRDKTKIQTLHKLNLSKLEQRCYKSLKTGPYIHK